MEAFPVGFRSVYNGAGMRRSTQTESRRPARRVASNALAGLPRRTLLRMVHHLMPEREAGIEQVLDRAHQRRDVAGEFRKVFQHLGISEKTFAALVVLNAFDPSPLTPGDLACHTNAQPRSIAATLRLLEDTGCVIRSHRAHRRGMTFVSLSRHGRDFAAYAVQRFLDAAKRLSLGQAVTDSLPTPPTHSPPFST